MKSQLLKPKAIILALAVVAVLAVATALFITRSSDVASEKTPAQAEDTPLQGVKDDLKDVDLDKELKHLDDLE